MSARLVCFCRVGANVFVSCCFLASFVVMERRTVEETWIFYVGLRLTNQTDSLQSPNKTRID